MYKNVELQEARELYEVINRWVTEAEETGHQKGYMDLGRELRDLLKIRVDELQKAIALGQSLTDRKESIEDDEFIGSFLKVRHRIRLLNNRIRQDPSYRPWKVR